MLQSIILKGTTYVSTRNLTITTFALCTALGVSACAATQTGVGPRTDGGASDANLTDASNDMLLLDLGSMDLGSIDLGHADGAFDTGVPTCTPTGAEIPYNGVDEDCDDMTSDTDVDHDGFAGGLSSPVDCDDNNDAVNPGVTEVLCNLIDDDCDTATVDRATTPLRCLTDQDYALSFAANQQVQVEPSTAFNFGTSPFTIEAWMKLSVTATDFPTIVSTRTSIMDGMVFMVCARTTSCASGPGALMFQIAGSNYIGPAGSPDMRDGVWHHVAVTRRGSSLKYYVDGAYLGSVAAAGSVSSSGYLLIGNDAPSGTSGDMNGSLLGVRIWNTERSATEINTNMDRNVATDSAGLVAYWRFNGGAGQNIYDFGMSGMPHQGVAGTNATVEPSDPVWVSAP